MAMSFKTKIIGSIVLSAITLITISAVVLAFSSYDNQQKAAEEKVHSELSSVQRLLTESAVLMNTKTTTAINVLREVTSQAGKVSVADAVEITSSVKAPNLVFGSSPQALNFSLVDKVKA